MATEAVVYRLELAGNLKTEAAATAVAVTGLGTAANTTTAKVAEHSKSAEAAKVAHDALKRSVGESAAGLVQFGGAAGVAAAAIGLSAAALFKMANAAVEARDRLREMNAFLDTPRIDRYATATSNLSTAFDELKISIGEGITGPMADILDLAARSIVKWADLSAAMREAGQLYTWWLDPAAAGATIAGVLRGDPTAGMLPTDTTNPPAWSPSRTTGGTARPASVSDYVGDPLGYRMGPGMQVSEGYEPDYASAMSQGLTHGLNSLGRALTDNTEAVERSTDAAGIGALGAAVGGGSLGTVVGMAAGGPMGAVVGPLIDQVISGTLSETLDSLTTSMQDLIGNLPEMVGAIMSETIPTLIEALPQVLSQYAISLVPELVYAVVGSVDEIGQALINAILGLPGAIATELAAVLNPFDGGGGGGIPGVKLPKGVTRKEYDAMAASGFLGPSMQMGARSRGSTYRRLRRDQGSYGLGYTLDPLVP